MDGMMDDMIGKGHRAMLNEVAKAHGLPLLDGRMSVMNYDLYALDLMNLKMGLLTADQVDVTGTLPTIRTKKSWWQRLFG